MKLATGRLFWLILCQGSWMTALAFLYRPPAHPSSALRSHLKTTAYSSSTSTVPSIISNHHGLEKAAVTLIDPSTNVQVVLLGCFHGSQTSARDVQALLEPSPTPNAIKAVVLELCASRFTTLRNDVNAKAAASTSLTAEGDDGNSLMSQSSSSAWTTPAWFHSIRQLSRSRGVTTGLASAILGLASGWQTAMAGLDPGLEFRTALQFNPQECDIILADQAVEETLMMLGSLPTVFSDLLQESSRNGWNDSFGKEADALGTAVFGSRQFRSQQLTVPGFMTRSPEAIKDLARLAVLPLFALQALSIGLSSDTSTMDVMPPATMMDAIAASSDLSVMLAMASLNLGLLMACYVGLALPATRVILRERDDRLAEGIRAACRVVARGDHDSDMEGPARVVAVLGLLHVNGVARRLLSVDEPADNWLS